MDRSQYFSLIEALLQKSDGPEISFETQLNWHFADSTHYSRSVTIDSFVQFFSAFSLMLAWSAPKNLNSEQNFVDKVAISKSPSQNWLRLMILATDSQKTKQLHVRTIYIGRKTQR